MSLEGRVALVTGSSRGIGAAIAIAFARAGARVAVHGRDAAAVAQVCGRIEGAGGRAVGVIGDVTRFEDIEAMRARVEQQLAPIDVLVGKRRRQPHATAPGARGYPRGRLARVY